MNLGTYIQKLTRAAMIFNEHEQNHAQDVNPNFLHTDSDPVPALPTHLLKI